MLVEMQQGPEGCFPRRSWLCTMPVPLEVVSSDVARIRCVSFRHERASAWANPEPNATDANDANDGCRLPQPLPFCSSGSEAGVKPRAT